jgi:hypothetical protein
LKRSAAGNETINPDKNRIISSPYYGPLMKDPTILFHGIHIDFWKIPSILNFGILTHLTQK